MTRLQRLKNLSKHQTRKLGHRMYNWENFQPGKYYTQCKDCGMHVHIYLNPKPDETEFDGTALILNCP